MIRGKGWLAAQLIWVALVPQHAAGQPPQRKLVVPVGKSLILDSPVDVRRVAVANGDLAEAMAVTPREVLINGKASGETSVVLWQEDGVRTMYDLRVSQNMARVELARAQLAREFGGQDVRLDVVNDAVFLQGTVKDLTSAGRAANIAGTLGKVVNLLRVDVPEAEAQILLKVRFADIDRSATTELGMNLLSTGATGTVGQITTGEFGPAAPGGIGSAKTTFSLTDALNIFLFRPDLNLGTVIRALQNKNLLEVLAEPNVLAINGKTASFVAGGEFPYPVVQGGASAGSVTIQFREYGVRISFLPVVTPRGTIRLQVIPEVSSLDFANGLLFQGFHIPALATRRVQTEVELESGQSFVIAGLLDNRMTETLSKIPGIGDIPLLGKLFHSRTVSRNNTELLVMVTPELVRPIPRGAAPPAVSMPEPFMQGTAAAAPHTPGPEVTGDVAAPPVEKSIPVEQLLEQERQRQTAPPVEKSIPVEQLLEQKRQRQTAPASLSAPGPASSFGGNSPPGAASPSGTLSTASTGGGN